MLILHVGRHKTGTSSLQHFLHANREQLNRHGVIYPEPIGAVAAHHGIALAMRRGDDISPYREMLRGLRPRKQTVLLSSEGFQRLRPKDIRPLVAGFPTTAVTYLREQFGYAWSAYAQKVCAGDEIRNFQAALEAHVPNYYNFLTRWAKLTGDNLKVRIFDRQRLIDGDVVADFCQAILSLDERQFTRIANVNETVGWRTVNFMRRLNEQVSSHPEIVGLKHHILNGVRRLASEYPDLLEKPKFPVDMREGYQALFVDQNRQIAAEFLGNSDAPLFDLSWQGDSDWNERESLTKRHVDALCDRDTVLRRAYPVLKAAGAE